MHRATETVRTRLLSTVQPDSAEGALRALHRASDELAKSKIVRDYAAAQALIEAMHRDGRLDEVEVMNFVRAQRTEEVVAALSVLCSTRLEIIERLMHGGHIDALLIPCKAAGLTWPTVKPLVRLNPCHRSLADDSYEKMRRDFQKLSIATAQRIIRFWQVRSTAEVPA